MRLDVVGTEVTAVCVDSINGCTGTCRGVALMLSLCTFGRGKEQSDEED